MVISVDRVTDGTCLIIGAPTGIYYEAQCDGIGCSHPTYEGVALSLGEFMQDFDDCDYGCSHISDSIENQFKLALDLNKKLIELTKPWMYHLSFDFDRLTQLKEGWWPVKISGTLDDWNHVEGEFIGILHTGNCD